jgi:anti-anti-sigma regulatory factor
MPPNSTPFDVRLIDGIAVVTFPDPITICVWGKWDDKPRKAFRDFVAQNDLAVIILDFQNQETQPSTDFYYMLITLHKRLAAKNGSLKLCNLPTLIARQLEIVRLDRILKIYPNLEDALSASML